MKNLLSSIGAFGISVLGFGFVALILLGPFIVAKVIPDQAYHFTFYAAIFALAIFMLSLVVGIAENARQASGVIMYICAGIVAFFLWVWSVLIVDETWGIAAVYIANFFFAVGAVFVAFIAALVGAHWDILWQLGAILAVAFVMQMIATAYASSERSSPQALTASDD